MEELFQGQDLPKLYQNIESSENVITNVSIVDSSLNIQYKGDKPVIILEISI